MAKLIKTKGRDNRNLPPIAKRIAKIINPIIIKSQTIKPKKLIQQI